MERCPPFSPCNRLSNLFERSIAANFFVSVRFNKSNRTQGSCRSWKVLEYLEFCCGIFQDWSLLYCKSVNIRTSGNGGQSTCVISNCFYSWLQGEHMLSCFGNQTSYMIGCQTLKECHRALFLDWLAVSWGDLLLRWNPVVSLQSLVATRCFATIRSRFAANTKSFRCTYRVDLL